MDVQVQPRNENEMETTSDCQESKHPLNDVDHRQQNGPLLNLLWTEGEALSGQTLYLGGEVGSDGKIYCIPGHGKVVLVL
jgi:hypothetical protein